MRRRCLLSLSPGSHILMLYWMSLWKKLHDCLGPTNDDLHKHSSPSASSSVSVRSPPLRRSPTEVSHSLYSNAALQFHLLGFLQRSPYDRGSVYGRQRADWFDLRFSLSLHRQMFIPFSVTDPGYASRLCVRSVRPYVGSTKAPGPEWGWLRGW